MAKALIGSLTPWDQSKHLFIAPSHEEALLFAKTHLVEQRQLSLKNHKRFAWALSGGSTPKALYKQLFSSNLQEWESTLFFWGDERCVPPDHPDSNYLLAMESGLSSSPSRQLFRMPGELPPDEGALCYEETLKKNLSPPFLDLSLLGLGEDGHTASLFPHRPSLEETRRWVTSDHPPHLSHPRITLTLPFLQKSTSILILALGSSKATIVKKVLSSPPTQAWPITLLSPSKNPSLWVLDQESAAFLIQ